MPKVNLFLFHQEAESIQFTSSRNTYVVVGFEGFWLCFIFFFFNGFLGSGVILLQDILKQQYFLQTWKEI